MSEINKAGVNISGNVNKSDIVGGKIKKNSYPQSNDDESNDVSINITGDFNESKGTAGEIELISSIKHEISGVDVSRQRLLDDLDQSSKTDLHTEILGSTLPSVQHPKKIKLFLASSSELKDDRRSFEIFINRQNKTYIDQGIFLELNLWEDFLDAMSQNCLQNEYNTVVKSCDIFVSLFWTKVGKYTEEEFTNAFDAFREGGKPLIFTYFKSAEINTADLTDDVITLLNFKKKLKALGHYCTLYTSNSDLEL